MKHTPGPWKVVPTDRQDQIEIHEKNGKIANYTIATVWGGLDSIEENAKLIAAAPALFEALRGLMENPSIALEDKIYDVHEYEGKGWDGPDVIAWGKAVEQAAKLIKKLS